MARKNKNLAGFGEVAETNNVSTSVNDDINIENNDINIEETREEPKPLDTLDSILHKKGKKKNTDKVLVGFYVKKELADILDDLQKRGGKGVKSQIINELLEKAFKEKGLL